MSKNYSPTPIGGRGDARPNPKRRKGRDKRRIGIRTVRRQTPDLGKLGRAVIAIALAQAEAERQAEEEAAAMRDSADDRDPVERQPKESDNA